MERPAPEINELAGVFKRGKKTTPKRQQQRADKDAAAVDSLVVVNIEVPAEVKKDEVQKSGDAPERPIKRRKSRGSKNQRKGEAGQKRESRCEVQKYYSVYYIKLRFILIPQGIPRRAGPSEARESSATGSARTGRRRRRTASRRTRGQRRSEEEQRRRFSSSSSPQRHDPQVNPF